MDIRQSADYPAMRKRQLNTDTRNERLRVLRGMFKQNSNKHYAASLAALIKQVEDGVWDS